MGFFFFYIHIRFCKDIRCSQTRLKFSQVVWLYQVTGKHSGNLELGSSHQGEAAWRIKGREDDRLPGAEEGRQVTKSGSQPPEHLSAGAEGQPSSRRARSPRLAEQVMWLASCRSVAHTASLADRSLFSAGLTGKTIAKKKKMVDRGKRQLRSRSFLLQIFP